MSARAEIVFVRLMVPFSLGIVACYNTLANAILILQTAACVLCFFLLLAANIAYAKFKIYKYKPVITLCTFLLSFFIGGLFTVAHKESLKGDHFARRNSDFLKVRIDDEPQVKNNIVRFKCLVFQSIKNNHGAKTTGHLLVSVRLDSLNRLKFNYGDELLLRTNFQAIKEAQNPFQFDVKSWLANQTIYHQSFLASDEVFKISSQQGNRLIEWALKLRQNQVDILQKRMKNAEAFSVASTLVLGYRSDLSAETLMAYSKTGTIHALSVSGMHVGIIYLVLNFFLNFMDRNKTGKVLKLLLIVSLIWFYALLSGLSPSVLRSVIMLSLYIWAKFFHKTPNSYNIIAFSAFCMLLYNPFLLYDVGFQLSYISVLGLVLLQPKISSWFTFGYQPLNKLWSALALSLSAQIATFPLAVYYFHQFPTYFLISNLFILLPISLIMYLGILILTCKLYFLMPIFEWLISFTNRGLKVIANLPFSNLNGIWIDKVQLLLLVAGLTLLIYTFINYQKRLLLLSFICILMLTSSCTYEKWVDYQQRRLIFFSLPKDFATAFILGKQAILVTNLKESSPAYRFFVQPTLSQLQISNTIFINAHSNYKIKGLYVKDHQISFFNKSIFFADTCFNRKTLQTSANFQFLLLSVNSKINLDSLLVKLRPKLILIDGTNSAYSAAKMAKQAKNFKIPSYNLKKLKAYLVNINK